MLIVLGVVAILAPLSGFPMPFRTLVTIICGALVLTLGLRMRTHHASASPEVAPDTDTSPAISSL